MRPTLIHISIETLNLPAPFAYESDIKIEPSDKGHRLSFNITHLFRDDISLEDIEEEGYTANDDFEWQGELGGNWLQVLDDVLSKTTYRKKHSKGNLSIDLNLFDNSGLIASGEPSELEMWEYFVQELTQAIYESGEREMPFEVKLKSIKAGETKEVHLIASFEHRSARLFGSLESEITWDELQQHMKTVFQPDYLVEHASEKEPKKDGFYVSTEPGFWYQKGKGIVEPTQKSKTIRRLEALLDELYDKSASAS